MKSVKLQQVERALLDLYPSLYRLAYSYVKNPDDAMDIVQESAYKAILRAEDMKGIPHGQTLVRLLHLR